MKHNVDYQELQQDQSVQQRSSVLFVGATPRLFGALQNMYPQESLALHSKPELPTEQPVEAVIEQPIQPVIGSEIISSLVHQGNLDLDQIRNRVDQARNN